MGSPTSCLRAENKQRQIENKIMTEFQKIPTKWYNIWLIFLTFGKWAWFNYNNF